MGLFCSSTTLGSAWSVSIHPKGEKYAASSGSGNVNVYSANPDTFGARQAVLSSGKAKHGMDCKFVGSLASFRFRSLINTQNPDGSRVALAIETGHIFIFDVESQSLTSTYSSHAMTVRGFAWSYDGNVRGSMYFCIRPLTWWSSY